VRRVEFFFRNLSQVAFFAWGSLGSDGFSLSGFGSAGGNAAWGEHAGLVLLVGLVSVVTIFAISSSFRRSNGLFPSAGCGTVAAGTLLPPVLGMVSGCALLVADVLTIALCVAVGADALFRFLPSAWGGYTLPAEVLGVLLLVAFSLRRGKQGVAALAPVLVVFVFVHALAILFGPGANLGNLPSLVTQGVASNPLGLLGMVLLMLRAYGAGAGKGPGVLSGGLGLLHGAKAQNGKRAMACLAVALSVLVLGLVQACILFDVGGAKGGTVSAVLFGAISQRFGAPGQAFVLATLVSEAAVLFVVAQTGFFDGARVLADMAANRWFPTGFVMLSDRLATRTGVRLMGGAALALVVFTYGSVRLLLVLYAINVLLAFTLSQLGLLRHWLGAERGAPHRRRSLALHGLRFALCGGCLALLTALHFTAGGWTALLLTCVVAALALVIRKHYDNASAMLKKLDALLPMAETDASFLAPPGACAQRGPVCNPGGETAVILVNGYNGLGLRILSGIHRVFDGGFENYIFVQVGMVDSCAFRSAKAAGGVAAQARADLDRYVDLLRSRGLHAEGVGTVGVDAAEEIAQLASELRRRFPKATFFGGRLAFSNETVLTRLLHNHIVFAVQRQLNRQGVPFLLVPIRLLAS